MLKLRELSSGSLIAMAAVCTTAAVAQTAPPALPPAASGTFATNSSSGVRVSSALGSSANARTDPSGSLTISYDSATAGYKLSNDPTVFGPAQAISSTANTQDYRVAVLSTGNDFKTFSTFKNPTATYSYTSYGLTYATRHTGAGSDTYTSEAFVFGVPTSATALPRTGAAYFKGPVDGYSSQGGRLVNSTGDLLANFTTGEIATGFNLSTASGLLGRFDGRGLIAAGTTSFSGSVFGSGITDYYAGAFNGGFYGPSAQEVGLTFELTQYTNVIAAAFIGTSTALPVSPTMPPATPVVPINTSLVAPLKSERFAAIGGNLMIGLSSAFSTAQSAVARTDDPGAITISYDATTNRYTLRDSHAGSIFAPATPSTMDAGITRDYADTQTLPYSLKLFVAGSSNPRLALTYLSYGLWTTNRYSSTQRVFDRSFVYGVETPAANLPRTGAALYDGVVAGRWATGNSTYQLDGRSDGSVLANFYTGEVRTTMKLAGTEIVSNAVATLGRVDGYGSITGGSSRFTGTMTGTDNGYSGNFQGAFYGPAHQEAGVSFALVGANGAGSVNGVLVAKQTPFP